LRDAFRVDPARMSMSIRIHSEVSDCEQFNTSAIADIPPLVRR